MLTPVPGQSLPSHGSGKFISFDCDCGRQTVKKWNRYTSGKTSTCGLCGVLDESHWRSVKYGKLRMRDPVTLHPHSTKKVIWICDCGREKCVSVHSVTSGNISRCGLCNVRPAEYWAATKFGRLIMRNPISISTGSNAKVLWICDCGHETQAKVVNITTGNTKSCGRCYDKAREWFSTEKENLHHLEFPIQIDQFPIGWMTPIEVIKSTGIPFRARCFICKEEYSPLFGDIKRGTALTCGCSTFRVSAAQQDISDFIISVGLDSETEYKVNGMKYDIYVPQKRLLIEYNGLKWHSDIRKDIRKYRNAIDADYEFIMIFEDEWIRRQDIIKTIIKNRLGLCKYESVRPSQCSMRAVKSAEADAFYQMHHYLGGCKSNLNYAAYFESGLVACVSFKRPTRQSKYAWELVRMAGHPDLKVHGIWPKLLGEFRDDHQGSILSFSDNRLFGGRLYGKMGFRMDGQIRPDYYWCKGTRRFHKSNFRKKPGETGSESRLRSDEGFIKIWDLGKTRWVLE